MKIYLTRLKINVITYRGVKFNIKVDIFHSKEFVTKWKVGQWGEKFVISFFLGGKIEVFSGPAQ